VHEPRHGARDTERRQPAARDGGRPTERRDGASRPSSRPAAHAPRDRQPPLEERPPGTFERPLSGGLLGHAARRAPPPRPQESDERRRRHHGRGR
jgi:hypothetical protein